MNRAIWKGLLSFGHIHIPVKLYPVFSEKKIRFHLLHDQDEVRLVQEMVCSYDNKPVPPSKREKGFEMEERKYIVLDDSDFQSMEPAESRVLQVSGFVDEYAINCRYYDRSYYLEGQNGTYYYLLLKTLKEKRKIGICQWAMRKRKYLGALLCLDETLALITMRYQDEIIPPPSFDKKENIPTEREIKTATDLIQALSGNFNPQNFHNVFQEKLRQLIEDKKAGKKIEISTPKEPEHTETKNLLSVLEESLTKVKRRGA